MHKDLNKYIQENWTKTVRADNGGKGIPLPYPITVPCISERFTCFFYWDTYFTNLGLMYDNLEQAKNNIENMRFFVETIGYIPNGNMAVMFNRSQPPLYSHAVYDLYCYTKDMGILRTHYKSMQREYHWWMANRMTPIGLNQYNAMPTDGEIFEFYEELKGRDNFKGIAKEKETLLHYFAEAESGWDFSPRFGGKALHFVQVDLNSILYKTECILAECSDLLGLSETEQFLYATKKRKTLMDTYMRDENGLYHDYNFVKETRSLLVTGASMTPFGMGVSNDKVAAKVTLEKLEFAYGVSVGDERSGSQGFQWAFPNMWAPITYWIYMGATLVGLKADAKRIKEKYMQTLERVYEQTGKLWEKYNVLTGEVSHSEYISPPMMGWTAGVYRYFQENE